MAALFDLEERRARLVRRYVPPKKWFEALCDRGNELMSQYQTTTIKTFDALLVELCEGDIVAKEMLRHLIFWWPHSVRPDGAIWRTAAEWKAEAGLTSSQVYNKKRRERLLDIGVIVETHKAAGLRTMHFTLDADKFTRAIARVIKWSFYLLKARLYSLIQRTASAFKKDLPSQMQNPLTDSTTPKLTETNNSESVDTTSYLDSFALLKNTKLLSANECKRYASLDAATVQACIDSMESAEIKTSRRAYFRAALKKQVEEQAQKKKRQANNPYAGLSWSDFSE